MIQLNAAAFSEAVLASECPVMVDFWAPWCGPCRALAPIIEELASEYQGRAKICKLNVDDDGALAAQYGVMSIPTVIVFHKGKEHGRVVGMRGKGDLSAMLDELL